MNRRTKRKTERKTKTFSQFHSNLCVPWNSILRLPSKNILYIFSHSLFSFFWLNFHDFVMRRHRSYMNCYTKWMALFIPRFSLSFRENYLIFFTVFSIIIFLNPSWPLFIIIYHGLEFIFTHLSSYFSGKQFVWILEIPIWNSSNSFLVPPVGERAFFVDITI